MLEMNNRGWIRIVEASIAVLLVLGTLFYVYTREQPSQASSLDELAQEILEEIASNNSMRILILSASAINSPPTIYAVPQEMSGFLSSRINSANLQYEAKICSFSDVCGKSTFTGEETYSAERIISAAIPSSGSGNNLPSRKVRLFIWRT